VPRDRTRGNRPELKHRKFHLNIRKLFYYEGGCSLEQVYQSICGVSILGDIQTPAGHGREQSAVAVPALGGGFALGGLQRFLQPW